MWWQIWKQRNKRIFEEQQNEAKEVLEISIYRMLENMKLCFEIQQMSQISMPLANLND